MIKKHLFIFLVVSVTVFMLMSLGISLTSAFSQVQKADFTDPYDVGELDLTNLVAEGNLSSVGNDGEEYTGEVDWYVFTATVTTTATITLDFDSGNDYDLFLYDANGSMVLDGSIYDNPEIVTYEVESSTHYLISVAGWDGLPGNYTLTISSEYVEPPVPIDPVELDFTDLTTQGSLSSVGNDGEEYTGEVDWYIFTATVTAIATITLRFDPNNDYDLFLYDANGSMTLDGSIYDNPEILTYEVAESTPYLICVAGWEGSPGDYTLTISPEKVEVSVEMDMPEGWSMISLPVRPDNQKFSELFPDAVVAYGYTKERGYVRVAKEEDLKIGRGYWILFNDAYKYTLTGRSINEYTLPVYEVGWDMIGGCTSPSRALTTNGHIAVIYRFVDEFGYQRVTESENIEAGEGYWIMYDSVMNQCELKVKIMNP